MSLSRREVIQTGIVVGAGAAAAGTAVVSARGEGEHADATGEKTQRTLTVLANIPQKEGEDVLLRMQRDLVKAMAKPMEQRHWVMVIDKRKCVGCHACTISCVAENHLPPGVVYRPVIIEEKGQYPNVRLDYTPRPCMQCDEPPCVPVCPVAATWKRKDGIVAVDYDACIGCRYCLTACPYGARTSDFGLNYQDEAALGADGKVVAGLSAAPNEEAPSVEYGKQWKRGEHDSPIGNARKCHFCVHRLENGMLPSCTTTCIGRATFFGDTNDPDSLVSELIAKNHTEVLLPHKGTKPRVFYIV